MSDEKTRLTIDLHLMFARDYVASKGRLPENKAEFVAWLMEFTDDLGNLLARWQESVMDAALLSVAHAHPAISGRDPADLPPK